MNLNPTDVDILGGYYPPLLIAFILAIPVTALTVHLLNRTRLARYFMFPIPVMVAMVTIYTVLIGTFVFPI